MKLNNINLSDFAGQRCSSFIMQFVPHFLPNTLLILLLFFCRWSNSCCHYYN